MLNLEEIKAREQAAESCLNSIFNDLIIGETSYNIINHALQGMNVLTAEVERLTKENAELDHRLEHEAGIKNHVIKAAKEYSKQIATLKKALKKLSLDYCMDTQTLKSGEDIYSEYIQQAEQLTHETHEVDK